MAKKKEEPTWEEIREGCFGIVVYGALIGFFIWLCVDLAKNGGARHVGACDIPEIYSPYDVDEQTKAQQTTKTANDTIIPVDTVKYSPASQLLRDSLVQNKTGRTL